MMALSRRASRGRLSTPHALAALLVAAIPGGLIAQGSGQARDSAGWETREQGWLGVFADLQFTSAPIPGESGFGVLVTGIHADGPAAVAGIQPGDRIVAISGSPLTYDRWIRSINSLEPGDSVWFTVNRNGSVGDLALAAGRRPSAAGHQTVPASRLASQQARLLREIDSLVIVLAESRGIGTGREGEIRGEAAVRGDGSFRSVGEGASQGVNQPAPTPSDNTRAGPPNSPAGQLRMVPADSAAQAGPEQPDAPARSFLARFRTGSGTFVLGGVLPRPPDGTGTSVTHGVPIIRVVPGSLADQIGFRQGDVIVAAAGILTPNPRELERVLRSAVRPFDIEILRDSQRLTLRFR